MTTSEFAHEGLGYVYQPKGKGLCFRADYLKRDSDGTLWARVEVTSQRDDVPRHITRGKFNISGGNGRANLAKECGQAAGGVLAADWFTYVNYFFTQMDDAEDQPPEMHLLGTRPRSARAPDVVEKIVQRSQVSNLFGPQGSCKGWVAIGLCVAVQTGVPFCGLSVQQSDVLYLDWEADQDTFNDRVAAVCAGFGIPPTGIRWMEMKGTLAGQIQRISRVTSRERIGLVAIDSVGHAAGAPSEHSSYEFRALELSSGLRLLLPASVLLIDHVSSEGVSGRLAGKAIGSIRKMADARVAWEIRKEDETESESATVGMYHTKFNNTRHFAPIGLRLSFDSDADGRATRVVFQRWDIADSPSLATRLNPVDHAAALMRKGAMSATDLATILDMPLPKVVGFLQVYQGKRFQRVGDGKWGLAVPAIAHEPVVPNGAYLPDPLEPETETAEDWEEVPF